MVATTSNCGKLVPLAHVTTLRCLACVALLAWSQVATSLVIDPIDRALGWRNQPLAAAGNPGVVGAASAADGRLFVVVERQMSGCGPASIYAFGANGELDATYGVGGIAEIADAGLPPCMRVMGWTLRPDGSVYVVAESGTAYGAGEFRHVWKATSSGRLDATFGSGGRMALSADLLHTRADVAALADWRVAIASPLGSEYAVPAMKVLAVTPAGVPDATFGVNGVATIQHPSRRVYRDIPGGSRMVALSDGSMVVGGNFFDHVEGGLRDVVDAFLVHLDTRGNLDPTFGTDGFAMPWAGTPAYLKTVAVQGDAIVVGGDQVISDTHYAVAARAERDGRVDRRFGANGTAQSPPLKASNDTGLLIVDGQQRVILLVADGDQTVRTIRFTHDGTLDSTYGWKGSVAVSENFNKSGYDFLAATPFGDPYFVKESMKFESGTFSSAITFARLAPDGGYRSDVTGGTAVIYYNASLDHYFMSAAADEQRLLDTGATRGWRRNERFNVVLAAPSDGELMPVCRFYGRPEAGLDSHFFSAAADECAAVKARFAASWQLETDDAFRVYLPDRTTGECPDLTRPVHRAFNNRPDANHFYGVFAFAPSRWILEGYGPLGVVFCAPLL